MSGSFRRPGRLWHDYAGQVDDDEATTEQLAEQILRVHGERPEMREMMRENAPTLDRLIRAEQARRALPLAVLLGLTGASLTWLADGWLRVGGLVVLGIAASLFAVWLWRRRGA